MYPNRAYGVGDCFKLPSVPTPAAGARGQIRCVEVTNVKMGRSGDRLVLSSFTVGEEMRSEKRQKFIKRFIDPMRKSSLGQNVIQTLNAGRHPVQIAWANGQFGFNGTIARNRKDAVGGQGSASVIFIDESAPDWSKLTTIKENPDVGLFHEFLHALQIQAGMAIDNERESENRVIGIGNYSSCKLTENAYRSDRTLPFRCCWDREQN
jgi:hypothetical protein